MASLVGSEMLQWQHQSAGAQQRKSNRLTEVEMSTKSSLILIVAIAFVALAGMGASRFVGPQKADPEANRTNALALSDRMSEHADALADTPIKSNYGEWYGAIPQSSSKFDLVRAARLRNVLTSRSEALAGARVTYGEWYGALPQTSPAFDAAAALSLRELIEQHGEALQK
jgi:hypothetical protein